MHINFMARRQIKVAEAYRRVFSSDDGKLVLGHILTECHLLHTTMSPNPYETAHQEGERNVALKIIKQLDMDVDAMHKALQAYEKERLSDVTPEP